MNFLINILHFCNLCAISILSCLLSSKSTSMFLLIFSSLLNLVVQYVFSAFLIRFTIQVLSFLYLYLRRFFLFVRFSSLSTIPVLCVFNSFSLICTVTKVSYRYIRYRYFKVLYESPK